MTVAVDLESLSDEVLLHVLKFATSRSIVALHGVNRKFRILTEDKGKGRFYEVLQEIRDHRASYEAACAYFEKKRWAEGVVRAGFAKISDLESRMQSCSNYRKKNALKAELKEVKAHYKAIEAATDGSDDWNLLVRYQNIVTIARYKDASRLFEVFGGWLGFRDLPHFPYKVLFQSNCWEFGLRPTWHTLERAMTGPIMSGTATAEEDCEGTFLAFLLRSESATVLNPDGTKEEREDLQKRVLFLFPETNRGNWIECSLKMDYPNPDTQIDRLLWSGPDYYPHLFSCEDSKYWPEHFLKGLCYKWKEDVVTVEPNDARNLNALRSLVQNGFLDEHKVPPAGGCILRGQPQGAPWLDLWRYQCEYWKRWTLWDPQNSST